MSRTLLTIALAVLGCAGDAHAQDPSGRTLDTTFTPGAAGRVSASNALGDVEVRGWDRAEVRLRVVLSPSDRLEIGRPLDMLAVARYATAASRPATLQLWVPRRSTVSLRNRDGAIALDSVDGAIRIDASRGPVAVRHATGALTINSSSGTVAVTDAGGSVEIMTSSASVTITRARGALQVETNAGDITLVDIGSDRANVMTDRGLIRYVGPVSSRAQHDLSSHRRGVHLLLNSNADATVLARALRGTVNARDGRSAVRDDGRDIVFGGGAATIRATTFSGEIVASAPRIRE